jgi:hypothetical protein
MGLISLAAAAMLADLDADQQALFVDKKKSVNYYHDTIPDYEIRNFISNLYHDKLYGFIADKECAGCKKRTFYTDKTLFPDFNGDQDSCLDHACYLAKWRKTLEKAVKAAVKENPELANARILVTNDNDIKKLFGNTVALGQDEYQVKPWSWETNAERPGKDTAEALRVTMTDKLDIRLVYWREKPPKKEAADSGFKPALRLLDLPKEEQKAVTAALKDKKLSSYEFNSNVRERVLRRLLEAKAALPGEAYSQKDTEFFIKESVFNSITDKEKKIFKLFMGYEYDGDARKLLSSAPWEKICAVITAMNMHYYRNIPDIDDFASGKNKKHLDWFPVTAEEARKIYQEEIRALLPKPKAEKKASGKKAKGEPAKTE